MYMAILIIALVVVGPVVLYSHIAAVIFAIFGRRILREQRDSVLLLSSWHHDPILQHWFGSDTRGERCARDNPLFLFLICFYFGFIRR